MDHIAIMNKKWGMVEKILSGEKTIESRWYIQRRCPIGCVSLGDKIYFKNTGEKVTAEAEIKKTELFENLNPSKIRELLIKHHQEIGIPKDQFEEYAKRYQDKKYALLLYLKNPQKVEPFDIDKSKAGYCSRAAWVSTENLNQIKK